MEELASSILDFQANMIRMAYRRKITPVDTDIPKVQETLDFIWQCARVEEIAQLDSALVSPDKWVKIGLGSEHIRAEFARVGMLGLDCLVSVLVYAYFQQRLTSRRRATLPVTTPSSLPRQSWSN